MPVALDIRHDLKQISRDLGRIRNPVMRRAVPQAINRTLVTVNARTRKTLSEQTKVKQKDISAGIRLFKARGESWNAAINLRNAKAKNLRSFVTASQQKPGRRGEPQYFRRRSKAKRRPRRYLRRGVKARAWGISKTYDGTFIARGRNNNVIVFRRDGKGRDAKVVGVVGPSPRDRFDKPETRRELIRVIDERLPIELDRALSLQMRRVLGGSR